MHAGAVDPWLCDLIVVRNGSHFASERQSLSRDVAHGRLIRVRLGVYVTSDEWCGADETGRHVIRMRALAAISDRAPVFSHWSAAVLHGLPFSGPHLNRVHITRPGGGDRAPQGVAPHSHAFAAGALTTHHGLTATSIARTVVDVAGSSPFNHGVTIADGALHLGATREQLLEAWDEAGLRRAHRRTDDVIQFAHPGAESAAESESRCSMCRLQVEPPELQVDVFDDHGFAARLDFLFRRRRTGGEVDGAKKYLDPKLAKQGAGRAVYDEKLREDRMRTVLDRLARWGWVEARSPSLLQPVLASAGVRPVGATFGDYCSAAAEWVPGARLSGTFLGAQ